MALALAGLLASAVPSLGQFEGYCFQDGLGLYAEEDAVLCQTQADAAGQTRRLWLIISFGLHNDNPIAELTAVFSGFPSEGVLADIEWLVPPTSGGGSLDGRLDWHFEPPWLHQGPTVVLGLIDIQILEPLAADIVVTIQGAATVDVLGQAYPMRPQYFTFNCTGAETPSCQCVPLDDCPPFPWLYVVTPQPIPGSEVAGDFSLSFTVSSFACTFYEDCIPGASARNYTGEVLVGGAQAASFSGSGEQLHTVPLSTAGWPTGSELPITVHMENQQGEQIVDFSYLVSDLVPAAAESWSRVKSRY